eukprot:CAMPEP_0197188566 /NCGR_PEP_ID=MMETSP1423-20130617/18023_1 /TAXON_ID=476441 /ORGANISM="Pseudo-nitzschia heimii, Strain UNC1101" /LENGTH=382 /DNA_ID=CAMNT_0042640433 /DNA_START=264 /DNA_END=1408 /DNA_ORIENTATION=+
MQAKEGSQTARRSHFPLSHAKRESKSEKHVSFSPYARCLKLEPQNLSDDEKSRLWWQKSDYDDFARVRRIISKTSLENSSEIWLRSMSASSSKIMVSNEVEQNSETKTKDDTMTESLSPPSTSANSPLHCDDLSESNSQKVSEIRGKWWHEFGHSRRGLEHMESAAEGRQRHLSTQSAIRTVLEEQRRQELFLPKGYYDVDGVRTAYLKVTQWARILARATGESDAVALRTNFESRRKRREHYLKEHFDRSTEYMPSSNDMHLPTFIKILVRPNSFSKTTKLDANTISQISFLRSYLTPINSELQKKNERVEVRDERTTPLKVDEHEPSSPANGHKEQEYRNGTEKTKDSPLAKTAAGWGVVDESPNDVPSALIGMGNSITP